MPPSKLAIQGAGHLAAALVEGFCRTYTAPLSIYNRTPKHVLALARKFPPLNVSESEEEFDSQPCPLLLLVPGRAILQFSNDRIARWRLSGRVIVSCANGLPLSLLERRFPHIQWVKAIPSVTAAVGKSVTLVAKGVSTPETGFQFVKNLFSSVGSVVELQTEAEMDRLSVVTSCLPGILAAILDELARTCGLSESQTRELLVESSLGSILLAKERAQPLSNLVSTVANPGGLTEAGVAVIREHLPEVFAHLKRAMDDKIQQRHLQFAGPDTDLPTLLSNRPPVES
jgi:pyrroline-5-carboxylate reductase